jgi:diguanylate cyclase (GGDEF)-like protein/PAS domain S-box-containing protein
MQNQRKTKAQLIAELEAARQSITEMGRQLVELKTYRNIETESQSLVNEERQQRAHVEMMFQAITALHSTLRYDEVLDHILDQLPQIIPHDAACIMLTQGQTARIFRWHGYGHAGSEGFMSPFNLKISEIPSLQTMQETGRPIVIPSAAEDDPWVARLGQGWIKSYLGAPVRVRDQVIGFVNLDSATPGCFGQAEAERLQAFLSYAVVALKNAWIYGQARREIMERVMALKGERNFVSAVLDHAGAMVVILNSEQRIVRFNRACEQATGYLFDEVKGKRIWELFIIPEEMEQVKAIFDKLAAGHFPVEYENQWLARDGDSFPIDWSSTVLLDQHGSVEYIVNVGHDITERKQVEEALRRGGERYALAVLAANEGLWDWDLQTDEIYFSPRWKAILGYQENELQSSVVEWFGRVHPEDLPRLKIDIAVHLEGTTPSFKSEYRMQHGDGDYRWVLTQGLAMRDANGQPYRLTGSQTDITRRKMTEDQLLHASLHDALTGLPNRALFIIHLKRAIERAQEDKGYQFAVLFLDLDRFKVINDSLGHLIGDQLLMTVARRLKACLRSTDTVARLGGDEFTILLDNIRQPEDAIRVVERIQRELALPITLDGQELFTNASIGIALSNPTYSLPEDVLRDADTSMYRAKAQGRGSHVTFSAGMHTRMVAIQELEAELWRAIERQEFQLHYQPIISLVTGQIVGVEALLRWQHPQRGLISPGEFIPLAEETGLIIPIGEWVLRTACAQTKFWHDAGHASLRLSVNVSMRQFQPGGRRNLSEMISSILAETGLAAQVLELEITESIPLVDNSLNRSILGDLKALGLGIALDDFGISSSLITLKQFPINTLKIDRSFIKEITNSASDATIITAIISVAHQLNLKVVAEGVETAEQLAWLCTERCDEIQGYLFSPPIPAPKLTELLQEGAVYEIGKVNYGKTG